MGSGYLIVNDIILYRIENLRNKTWMLNHGVADDNVHYQNSMLLTKALQQADIQFVQHSYPDENHSLGGVSRFLYHAMDDFWKQCFEINDTKSWQPYYFSRVEI